MISVFEVKLRSHDWSKVWTSWNWPSAAITWDTLSLQALVSQFLYKSCSMLFHTEDNTLFHRIVRNFVIQVALKVSMFSSSFNRCWPSLTSTTCFPGWWSNWYWKRWWIHLWLNIRGWDSPRWATLISSLEHARFQDEKIQIRIYYHTFSPPVGLKHTGAGILSMAFGAQLRKGICQSCQRKWLRNSGPDSNGLPLRASKDLQS